MVAPYISESESKTCRFGDLTPAPRLGEISFCVPSVNNGRVNEAWAMGGGVMTNRRQGRRGEGEGEGRRAWSGYPWAEAKHWGSLLTRTNYDSHF